MINEVDMDGSGTLDFIEVIKVKGMCTRLHGVSTRTNVFNMLLISLLFYEVFMRVLMNNTSHKTRSVLLLLPRQFVKVLGGKMKDTDVVKKNCNVYLKKNDANSDGVITTNDLGVIMRSVAG